MRNDSEAVLLTVLIVSGAAWFVIKALWLIAAAVVRAMQPKPEEHPVEWHGQAPPVCRVCGYDLRGSPEHCSECGAPLDPVDATIVRYMISLGHQRGLEGSKVKFGFRRRGELKYRASRG